METFTGTVVGVVRVVAPFTIFMTEEGVDVAVRTANSSALEDLTDPIENVFFRQAPKSPVNDAFAAANPTVFISGGRPGICYNSGISSGPSIKDLVAQGRIGRIVVM